jgi:hypothetical protein
MFCISLPNDSWAFFFAPLWFCILFLSVVMSLSYLSVRRRAGNATQQQASDENQIRSSFMVSGGTNGNRRSSFLVGQAQNSMRAKSFVIPKGLAQRIQSTHSINPREGLSDSMITGEVLSNSEISATRHVLDTLETYISAHHQNLEANQFGSRAVFRQSVLYMFAFYATYTFATLNRLIQRVTGKTFFTLIYLHAMFLPLQGFFNVMVYRYAYYFRLKHRHPHMSELELLRITWRWSVLGPPKGKRKSALDSAVEVDPDEARKPPAPAGLGTESVPDVLRVPTLADDVMDGATDDHLYDMAYDLMVTYSDFPNILADDAVMVSTNFPSIIVDDYPFTGGVDAPHAFPTTMCEQGPMGVPHAFPTTVSEDGPIDFSMQ